MADSNQPKENDFEKVKVLDTIFEDLVTDASELVKDLYWGVKTYMFFGLISLLFGIQEIVYNMEVLQERFYIPLFVGGVLIFTGVAQIINYFRLRGKYSRLFKTQSKMRSN